MKHKEIEKEIKAIENVVELLNECLIINLRNLKIQYAKNCLKDIQLCKRELKKLGTAQQVAMEAIKEQAHDDVQRSRKSFL
jgi:hypothetical protein